MLVAFPTLLSINRNSIALLVTSATGKGLIIMHKSELYTALQATSLYCIHVTVSNYFGGNWEQIA